MPRIKYFFFICFALMQIKLFHLDNAMKLKFPKKLTIGDVVWTVKYEKNNSGGSFNYKYHILKIGTKHNKDNPTRTLNAIIHELKEIIQVENDTRLDRGNNDADYVFVYDH